MAVALVLAGSVITPYTRCLIACFPAQKCALVVPDPPPPPRPPHLDGLGEGQAHVGGAQLPPLPDAKAGHRQQHGGAHEVADEGEPEVEGLGAEQGAVRVVHALRGDVREVGLLVEGLDDAQAVQGLGHQGDQVACGGRRRARRAGE